MTISRREMVAALLGAGLAPALASNVVEAQTSGDGVGCTWLDDQSAAGYGLYNLSAITWEIVDVRTVSSPQVGEMRYHDGSGANKEGPAVYRSDGEWTSLIDGAAVQ